MRLVTYAVSGSPHAGVLVGERVLPVADVAADLPDEVAGVIEAGPEAWARLARAAAAGEGRGLPFAEVVLMAPIPVPRRNVFCVGKNYHEHAREFQNSGFDSSSQGQDIPDCPIVFTKPPTAVVGPGVGVESALDPTGTLDYEGELAVVIGRGGRGIAKAAAYEHVFGYTVVNDVTARRTQNRHKQWFLGKSADTFCPMGPAIVTADEVGDPAALRLVTTVNGEERQNALVRDLIFDIPTLIETISAAITLQPGDVIATGTPAGVAVGFTPPRYLRPGDRVAVTIDRLGTLENPIV